MARVNRIFWMLRPYQRLFKYSLIVWIRRNIILKIKVRVGESFSPVGVRSRQADNSPTSLSDLIPTYICPDKPLALGETHICQKTFGAGCRAECARFAPLRQKCVLIVVETMKYHPRV